MLVALTSVHAIFHETDFMWLGIKPSIVLSYTTASFLLTACTSALGALLTLVSPWQQLKTDSVLLEVFEHAGLSWMKYVIGPGVMLCMLLICKPYFKDIVINIHEMAESGFIPSVFQKSKTSYFPTLLGVTVVGMSVGFVTLFVNFGRLLDVAALCVILQMLVICYLATALRYKPSYQMQTLTQSHQEDSILIGRSAASRETALDSSCGVESIGDNLYGAVASRGTDDASTAVANDNSNNNFCQRDSVDHVDNIDDIVEEYRMTSAMQCYQAALQATVKTARSPNRFTYRMANACVIIFTCLAFVAGNVLTRGWLSVNDVTASLVVWCVFSCALLLVCVFILGQQPKDKITPRTLLLQAPTSCVVAMVTILILATLATTFSALCWMVVVLWMASGKDKCNLYQIYTMYNA